MGGKKRCRKCKNCGKWGLFLKLSENKLCESCETALTIERKVDKQKKAQVRPKSTEIAVKVPKASSSRQQTFDENVYRSSNSQIDNAVMPLLYELSTYKQWVRDAVKPDVYFSNYDELLRVLPMLIEYEPKFPFYKPLPSEMLEEYTSSRSELTNNYIYRWWDSVLNQASTLKTVNGKQNKIRRCVDELMRYKSHMSEDNISLIKRLTEDVIDLANLEKKEKEAPVFDLIGETQILNSLKSSRSVLEKHFNLIYAQDFYYKFRKTDEKYLDKCIELCLEDIELLDKLNDEYKREEIEMWAMYSDYRVDDDEDKEYLKNVKKYGFDGVIPAWKRLCIVYTNKKQFDTAIKYCEKAIEYYESHGMSYEVADFKQRKDKLMAKSSNASNSKGR